MIDGGLQALTLIAAVGTGVMAGFFFAFSTSVMKALGRLPTAHSIAAMQSINVTVINPVFLTTFFGTAAVCLLLAIGALVEWRRPGSALALGGSVFYLVGAMLVTMVCNVPRNNQLAEVDPAAADASLVWGRYLTEWTMWNHGRTLASAVAMVALLLALHRGN